jgi:glycosyltransferase involved in cell wall biosynthesis
MKEPLISVVMPVYRVEKYIARYLRSLFDQTMTAEVEFIWEYAHSRENIRVISYERNAVFSVSDAGIRSL